MAEITQKTVYDIYLAMAIGAGGGFYGLLDNFENAEEIFRASESDLILEGIPEALLGKLIKHDLSEANRIAGFCERYGIKILVYGCPGYPEKLKYITNPPYLLYVLGELPDFEKKHGIGMVGTRRMSAYGMETTYRLSYELASAGLVTVSGLARGIDGVAACGTLEAGGTTVAVIGTGLDTAYPSEHRKLMKEIAVTGAVVSEFAPGSPPASMHFPMRNRIISGLSDALFVAEADRKSGAMLTAEDAKKQGRKIFALPGRVGDRNSEGPNRLLSEGHSAVTCSGDVLSWFSETFPGSVSADAYARSSASSHFKPQALLCRGVKLSEDVSYVSACPVPDTPDFGQTAPKTRCGNAIADAGQEYKKSEELYPEDKELLEFYLGMPKGEPVSPDYFISRGYGVPEAVTMLTLLEIGGYIRSKPGGTYQRQ